MSDSKETTLPVAEVATEQKQELDAAATDEVGGGVLPLLPIIGAAVGAGVGFVSWTSSGGYQDSVDLVAGFMQGFDGAVR